MPRHAYYDWNLPEGTPTKEGTLTHHWDSVHAAILMDIRGELQKLNRLLHCSNFIQMPRNIKAIRANTAKKRKRKSQ